MARIAGIDLPRDKRIEVALTYIAGIGMSSAQKILAKTNVNPDMRVRDMDPDDIAKLRDVIVGEYKVEGALRSEIHMNIKRLMDIGCYRGLRHRRNMPVRGQRTHTNARTRRGKRGVSVGIKKKK
ncbi:MAG: 30S ribosomal protein S13 [Calditrichaeota bacterium]|nr:30S ribosomal protein S13 [Actinomycetota bacterium]NOY59773.1 30S ribosomal protein S13 [Calditrichota bacterium]